MSTMKAVRFEAYGPPSALSLRDVAVPALNPGEVLVRIDAAAVNPSDVKIVSGLFNATTPRTPGRDFAGLVVAGAGQEGREVWGSGAGFGFRRDGAMAQFAVVPAAWLSDKPRTLSMAQAAAVGAPYVAAWSAIVTAGRVEAGQTVLITGALGAVGRAATEIAHWKGAKVISADRSDRPSKADHLIDLRRQELVETARGLTGGRGVDLVLDAVGGELFEPALRTLASGGRQVAITSVGSSRVSFDLADFYHARLQLVGLDTAKLSGEEIALILDAVRGGFEGGHFEPPAVRTWPLDDARAAFEAVAAGTADAKPVLLPAA
ncbi:zinc-binding alcohol dehydrogenase family protein [Caulobacter sp. CCNWLY153]|uniref:quinone oxidoreductase family protein n=1 Tax=unclassified Caulobacter TaxID=2648921 RepID=UPI002FF29799